MHIKETLFVAGGVSEVKCTFKIRKMESDFLLKVTKKDLDLSEDIKTCVARIMYEEDLDVKANNFYRLTQMGNSFSLLHKLYNINDLLNAACFSAFELHGNDHLYDAVYKFLIFLAKNCRWADDFLKEKGIHNYAKEALVKPEMSEYSKLISIFLLQLIKIDKDSFENIFDPSILGFFIHHIKESDPNSDERIWPLNCIQTITSLEFFDNNEALDAILQLIEEELNAEYFTPNFAELCLSILSNVFISSCDDSLKERASQKLFMDIGNNIFDPENERVCLSVVSLYTNAVYYDEAVINYLVSSSAIEHIASLFEEIAKRPLLLERCLTFFTNCISSESNWKSVIDILMSSQFLPAQLIPFYDMYKQTVKSRIAIFICKFIRRLEINELKELIDVEIINALLDELMVDDDKTEANILCAFLHYFSLVKVNPGEFASEIEAINDPSLNERLYEIIDNEETDKFISQAAQLVHSLIEELGESSD